MTMKGKKFITERDFIHLIVGLFVYFQATAVMAQSYIITKHNLMYTDVSIFDSGLCSTSLAMIDTGASVCIIDSTYAIDSCQIKDKQVNATMGNTRGKNINTSYVYVDSIAFGGVVYPKVRCYIVDLVGKLEQFAPKFIVGGEILKKDLWCYDLKKNTLQRYTATPDNVVATIKWENYADAALNLIYFNGKIGGKKTRTLFDTGAVRNVLTSNFDLTPTEKITIQSANIAKKLIREEVGLCKNIPVEISKYTFNVDFIKKEGDGSKYPRINAGFLQDKKWVLDYKRRWLLILGSD